MYELASRFLKNSWYNQESKILVHVHAFPLSVYTCMHVSVNILISGKQIFSIQLQYILVRL